MKKPGKKSYQLAIVRDLSSWSHRYFTDLHSVELGSELRYLGEIAAKTNSA